MSFAGRFLAALAAAWLAVSAVGCRAPRRPAPNILLVTLDTVRADRLGCYGHRGAQTPNLDRLAQDGVRFEVATTPTPLTLPAHATLLTGLHPLAHGVRDNGMVVADLGISTLAERLSASGYDTAAFVSAFVLNRVFGLDRGFSRYDDGPSDETALIGLFRREAPGSERVDAAIRWLSEHPAEATSRPFCLWLHLFDAHAPHVAPPGFEVRFAANPYDGEIAYLDAQVGRLVSFLEARNLARDTVLVVTADHGEGLGEHGEPTHGTFLYESTLRVPLLIRAPERLAKGIVRGEPVSLADVAPTLLALAGLPPNPVSHGVDLFGPGRLERRALLFESIYGERHFGWAPLRALRRDGWKYVDAPRPELYDLTSDPSETANRMASASSQRVARSLADALTAEAHRLTRAGKATDHSDSDAEIRSRLQSLGYVAGTTAPRAELGIDPKDGMPRRAVLDRAYEVLSRGDPRSAQAMFHVACRSIPENPEAWLGLGKTLEVLENWAEAESAYREAVKRDPQGVLPLARLYALAERRADVATQVEYARRLAELLPRHAPSQERLAEALRRAEEMRTRR